MLTFEHIQLQSNLSAPAEADDVEFVLDTLEGQSAIVSIASYVANDRPTGRYGGHGARRRLCNTQFNAGTAESDVQSVVSAGALIQQGRAQAAVSDWPASYSSLCHRPRRRPPTSVMQKRTVLLSVGTNVTAASVPGAVWPPLDRLSHCVRAEQAAETASRLCLRPAASG